MPNPNPDPLVIAEALYTYYCHNVGGKAWNGDLLPTWKEFRSDAKKRAQSDAWVATAIRAIELLT